MSRFWAGVELGDPSATRSAILAVVDAEKPPLRIFFGKAQLEGVTGDYESRLATLGWRHVTSGSPCQSRPSDAATNTGDQG